MAKLCSNEQLDSFPPNIFASGCLSQQIVKHPSPNLWWIKDYFFICYLVNFIFLHVCVRSIQYFREWELSLKKHFQVRVLQLFGGILHGSIRGKRSGSTHRPGQVNQKKNTLNLFTRIKLKIFNLFIYQMSLAFTLLFYKPNLVVV